MMCNGDVENYSKQWYQVPSGSTSKSYHSILIWYKWLNIAFSSQHRSNDILYFGKVSCYSSVVDCYYYYLYSLVHQTSLSLSTDFIISALSRSSTSSLSSRPTLYKATECFFSCGDMINFFKLFMDRMPKGAFDDAVL